MTAAGTLAGCGGGGSTESAGLQAGIQSLDLAVVPSQVGGVAFGNAQFAATYYPGAQYAAYFDLGFTQDVWAPGITVVAGAASQTTISVPLPLGAYDPVSLATGGPIRLRVSVVLNGRQATRDVTVIMALPPAPPFQAGSILVLVSQLQREMYRRGAEALTSASDRNLLNQHFDQVYGASGIPASFLLLTDSEISRMETLLFSALLAIGIDPRSYVLPAGGLPPIQGPTTEAVLVPSGTAQGTSSANTIFAPGAAPAVDFFVVGDIADAITLDIANFGFKVRKISSVLALAAGVAAGGASSRAAPLTGVGSVVLATGLLTGLANAMVYDNVRRIAQLDTTGRAALREDLRFYDEIVLIYAIQDILIKQFYTNLALLATEERQLLAGSEAVSDSAVAAPVARKVIGGTENVTDIYNS